MRPTNGIDDAHKNFHDNLSGQYVNAYMHRKRGLSHGKTDRTTDTSDRGQRYRYRTHRLASHVSLLIALFFYGPFVADAQIPGDEGNQIQVYGQPGNPKMTVYVWGQAQTGLWSVDVGTDLLEFASIITTTGLRANRPEQETTLILQLFREGRTDRPFYEKDIEEFFASRTYPELNDGDIIVIKERTRRRFTWRDVSQVLGTVTSTVSLILLIDRLRN
jgi:hypothetical protein